MSELKRVREAVRAGGRAGSYKLTLECGHVETRKASRYEPGQRIRCFECDPAVIRFRQAARGEA